MFFQLKVRLNIHISQRGKITIAWYSRKNRKLIILRKPGIDDVIHKGLSRGMSHQIAIVLRSYHGRVILTTNQNRHNFASQL